MYKNEWDRKKSLAKMLDKEYLEMHENRMQKVKNLSCKVLISDRDNDIDHQNYKEYRRIPSEYFSPLPIYIYDRKIAFVIGSINI